MTPATITGDLCFGHILAATGLDLDDILVLRHTYTDEGLASPSDLTPDKVLEYTRWHQIAKSKLEQSPPRFWLIFIADGGRRSRLLVAYENHGELLPERTDSRRIFDLRPCDLLSALSGRLVIEWSGDTVNWAKHARSAALFRVVEIVDREPVPFPGYDQVLITHRELEAVVDDPRYAAWRTALSAVQGIYLIADTSTGKLYVGKADGTERYSGAGPAMREPATEATSHCGSWPASTPTTHGTCSSASCGSSDRPHRPRT
ncbi:hypothetical protein ABIA39_000280 [Nocardia sp. GAS34]|uniref:GIY-YIG nuclease family protein n=1 Tax=unclassified Nocardia TaxID=2637762 RepID=UPI003D1FD3A5